MKYDLLAIYEKEIRKNMKNKRKLYFFECYKYSLLEDLRLNTSYPYHIFLIYEPKVRVVMALDIKEKIINHALTRNILLPKLERYLDPRNVATRKDMGTDYARRLVKKYLIQKKQKKFYILKLDISHYFYSIDHEVLKSLLIDKLTEEEYDLIVKVIDSTNKLYINKKIEELEKASHLQLPHYEYGKGLPIGNMTSQFLSVFYLYQLDHKIVHDYHIPCYVRYMDDFILIHEDKEYLKEVLNKIQIELNDIYHLELNKKKSRIYSSEEGFLFLGVHYKIKNKRVVSYLPSKRKVEIRKKIKRNYRWFFKNKKSIESIFSSRECFLHSYKVGREFVRRNIYEQEKFFFKTDL